MSILITMPIICIIFLLFSLQIFAIPSSFSSHTSQLALSDSNIKQAQQYFSLNMLSNHMTSSIDPAIITNDVLNDKYNDQFFNNGLTCANGELTILQFSLSEQKDIAFQYEGLEDRQIISSDIVIYASPNISPQPYVSFINNQNNTFIINANCSSIISLQNYYNLIQVRLFQSRYIFSFLLNCDKDNRHKKFQFGYLFITLINAAIIVGVALHSRVWSIKIHQKPLRIQLTFKLYLVLVGVFLLVSLLLLLLKASFEEIFQILKYVGLAISLYCLFICINEILFLNRKLKRVVLFQFFRICDVVSMVLSLSLISLTALQIIQQNWMWYDLLSICICIASIKMFNFTSLKQAYITMSISVVSITTIVVLLHFLLVRSYNDYATELSSPLFLQVPDMVSNLYKKCSWLCVLDVILPGVCLSYLRTYDQNYSLKWGGVYTILGNFSFIASTLLWIIIQLVYPFSVPFSLVTYPILAFTISILAWKRNQFKTLFHGTFYMNYEEDFNKKLLEESKKSFGTMISDDILQRIRVNDEGSFEDEVIFSKRNSINNEE